MVFANEHHESTWIGSTGKLQGFESSNIKQRRSWSAVCIFFLSREFCCKILSFCDRSRESGKLPGPACASPLFGCHSKVRCRCRWVLLCLMPQVTRVKGVDAELTEIGGHATHFATTVPRLAAKTATPRLVCVYPSPVHLPPRIMVPHGCQYYPNLAIPSPQSEANPGH